MWEVRAQVATDLTIMYRPTLYPNHSFPERPLPPLPPPPPPPLEMFYEQKGSQHLALFTLTFTDSLSRLWGSPVAGSQLCTAALFLFSGCWPHIKLLLLLCSWVWPMREASRQRLLYWVGSASLNTKPLSFHQGFCFLSF